MNHPWVLLAGALVALGCSGTTNKPIVDTPVTRETHNFFPINAGVHNLDCETCHAASESFRQYHCTNCHAHTRDRTVANHFSITENFVYEDTSCYTCHPTGSGVRFDHARYFPIREGAKHAGLSCIECHQNTADRHEVSCLGCHPSNPTDMLHSEVAQGANGYERVASACLKCHPDSRVQRVAAHLPFHISSGFPHYLTPCGDCHRNVVFDKPWQIDFTVRWCLDCHYEQDIAEFHADKPTYRYDNVTCLSVGCHAQGTRNN